MSSKLLRPVNLGRNGPRVSRFGFGLMGLSSFYTTDQIPEGEIKELVRCAVDLGINFFDTAPFYGNGTNEKLLGAALKGLNREDYFVSTQFGVCFKESGKPCLDCSPECVKKSVTESLNRLGLEYIDLYYPHRIDPNTPIEKMMGALAELVKQGKIRYIGLPSTSAENIRKAHQIHPITAVEAEYSLWSRDIESNDVMKTCRELGISIVAYSPLGRGFLTGQIKSPNDLPEDDVRRKDPRFQGENFQKNLTMVKAIEEVAKARKVTPSQVALNWVLSKGEDILPLFGACKLYQLREDVSALSFTLNSKEIQHLEEVMQHIWPATSQEYISA